MKKAIYPGSFDPITSGHLDIINRATTLFDEVHVAVSDNPSKDPLFSFSERIELIESVAPLDKIKVGSFNGLLIDYALKNNITTIIRGLRAVSDFDYEFQMALTNRKLNDKIDTIFLMTDAKYSYLSSSLVKQLAMFNADIEQLVPLEVSNAIKRKMNYE